VIHYHGTPIGGSRQDVARFLMGRHALVPFARPDDLPAVMECAQSFVVDNSAYSIWKAGRGRIDFDAYMDFVRRIWRSPSFEWCLIPDAIDGTEEENARLVHEWCRCGPKFRGVPVWHMHESLGYLEYLVNNWQTVALGSSGQWATPGTPSWWVRMAEAMAVACDATGRPKCKLHGLRMLDPGIFRYLPLASADSTSVARHCTGSLSRFGTYTPPTASQRAAVIADRVEVFNSAAVWERPPMQAELAIQESA
jgi:hypothetical protein